MLLLLLLLLNAMLQALRFDNIKILLTKNHLQARKRKGISWLKIIDYLLPAGRQEFARSFEGYLEFFGGISKSLFLYSTRCRGSPERRCAEVWLRDTPVSMCQCLQTVCLFQQFGRHKYKRNFRKTVSFGPISSSGSTITCRSLTYFRLQ
jgi:hypothetical protein